MSNYNLSNCIMYQIFKSLLFNMKMLRTKQLNFIYIFTKMNQYFYRHFTEKDLKKFKKF